MTQQSPPPSFSAKIEESFIALTLGSMTLITFANVVARYVFNSNILWALEATVFLFAWLILIGMSYCVRINTHLGVDALVNALSPAWRRALTLIAALCCISFAAILLAASWEYWWKFATKGAFLETDDIPFPVALQSIFGLVDSGEATYEYLPRFVPYFALPLGSALLLLRFVQALWQLWRGERHTLIASHEVAEQVDALKAQA